MSYVMYEHRVTQIVVGLLAGFCFASVTFGQTEPVHYQEESNSATSGPVIFHAVMPGSTSNGVVRLVLSSQVGGSGVDTVSAADTRTETELQNEIQDIQKELESATQQIQIMSMDSMPAMDENMQEIRQRLQEAMEELEQLRESGIYERLNEIRTQVTIPEISSRPFVGLIVDNMDFQKAYELHYNYNYGVLVTGIIPNSPADQAGLARGDIIMEFDSQKVRYPDMLRNWIETKNVGDEITVLIFRNEQELTRTLTIQNRMITMPEMSGIGELPETPEMPEPPAPPDTSAESVESPQETQGDWGDVDWEDMNWDSDDFFSSDFFDAGYGGGGWLPIYVMMDMKDINTVVEGVGFNPLPKNGIFVNGGAGKGPVGNGWFIGGMGGGYGLDRKINYTINPGPGEENVIRRMKFSMGFGGVTMDKRYRLSDKIVLGTGFMLGGGGMKVELNQTTGDYNWNELPDNFSNGRNSYLKMNKSYLMFQPRGTALLRITDWFSIRSEVGYLMGISFKQGWEADVSGETFEVANSPDNNIMGGFTFSIGPWFGF